MILTAVVYYWNGRIQGEERVRREYAALLKNLGSAAIELKPPVAVAAPQAPFYLRKTSRLTGPPRDQDRIRPRNN